MTLTNFTLTKRLRLFFTNKINLFLISVFISISSIAQGSLEITGNSNSILTGSSNSPAVNNNTDFGNVEIGSYKANTFVLDNTASNNGNPSYQLEGIMVSISGSGSADFTPSNSNLGNLKGNGTPLNHIITFTPSSSGIKTATVTVTFTNGTNSPYTFTIKGTGILPPPEIEIEDSSNTVIDNNSSFDFGSIEPNSNITVVFTIKNASNSSSILNLTNSPFVTINGDSEFTITAQPSVPSIVGGNSLSFNVSYNPSLTGGSHSASISIANNDPNKNPYVINLQGFSASLSVNEFTETKKSLSLIPNPASTNFKILNKSGSYQSILNVEVNDIQGRIVKQIFHLQNNSTIDTSSFTNGLYIVKVKDENHNVIDIKKLVIKQ